MLSAIWQGLVAGYGIALPVGAIAVLIITLSARYSPRVGIGAALGAATADGVYATVAVVAGAAAAPLIAPWAGPMRIVAAVALAGLAVRTAWHAWRDFRAHQVAGVVQDRPVALGTPGRAFLGVLGLTLLNPATIVYFAALVLGRRASGPASGGYGALFVAAAFVASASWQLVLAAGGAVAGRALSGPRGQYATAVVSSIVIAVLAGLTAIGF